MSEVTPSVLADQAQHAKVTTLYLAPRQARCKVRRARLVFLESAFGLVKVTKREALSVLPRSKKTCPQIRVGVMFDGESVAISAVR